MFANPEELLRYLSTEGVKFVDVRFCDLPGVMQHFTVPVESFDDSVFTDGLAFDGSSIRGFQQIHESDMLLLPDVTTAFVDPFRDAEDARAQLLHPRPVHPRGLLARPAQRGQEGRDLSGLQRHRRHRLLRGRGRVLHLRLDPPRDLARTRPSTHIDSVEGWWNTGREEEGGNRGYKTAYKGGYFPVPPVDHYADLRDAMIAQPHRLGLHRRARPPRGRHRRPGGDQLSRSRPCCTPATSMQLFKYIIKNTAWAAGKTATFMPKPLFGDNGSGMHTHQSLWLGGEPLFYDETGYGGLSDIARWYVGGLLRPRPVAAGLHQPDGQLLPPPGARLRGPGQPGLLAAQPVGLHPHPGHRQQRQGQAHRVPRAGPVLQPVPRLRGDADGRPRRRPNKIEPPAPIDKDLYDLPPEEIADVTQVPGSLPEVLTALESDHDYPARGWRLHPRPDRDVDRLEAGERDRPGSAAPDPARVRHVLRLLRHLTSRAAAGPAHDAPWAGPAVIRRRCLIDPYAE